MNNKNGFTMMELLGSIVILGLIALVAFPSILNFMDSSKDKIDEASKKVIVGAAKDYAVDNNIYDKIFVKDLIDNGYITNKSIIENNSLENSCVIVGNDGSEYVFSLNDCSQ